ncbi:O-acetylhomoserine (thiol)-lyase, partial [Penicillium capsulatum]
MADQTSQHFETLQLHAGHTPDLACFTIPTVDAFEKRIATLEGGIGAAATFSGQTAQFLTIATLAKNLMNVLLPGFGVTAKLVRGVKPEDYAAAIDDKTKAIYIESMSNPDYVVPDFEGIAKIAHEHGVPLVVDNTFGAGGYYIRPIEHGADIVVYSATKWIGGHGTTIGGVVVDSGKFEWTKDSARFPEMVEPSPSYHGLRDWEAFGPAMFIFRIHVEMLRDIGACMSPFAARQLLLGIETLGLQAERHAQSTAKLTEYFEPSPHVSWVLWPGWVTHATHAEAKKYLPRGFGGMLSIGVKGDAAAGSKVVDGLRFVSNLANVGDAKSLAIHPWTTTHEQLSGDERKASGLSEDMIRVSVELSTLMTLLPISSRHSSSSMGH